MNDLLKKILPGLLPLVVFILADELFGTKIGLIIAIGVGLIQFIVIYLRDKYFDKFIILDTILILILGLISIILDNEIFFKLKPGIIQVIILVILAISAFSNKNIMLLMSQRYLQGIEIKEEQAKLLKRNMLILFWIFLFHTILVFYSAFFMSKQAWGFISGVLLYLIIGIYFLINILKTFLLRRKNKKESFINQSVDDFEEYLPELDDKANIIARISRTEAHNYSKKIHPVVHVHVFNDQGDILLQKRSKLKTIQPNKWDTAVGGHVLFNEKIDEAIARESKEELGVIITNYKFITKYFWETDIEKELVFMYFTILNKIDFIPNEEVDELKFWSAKEIHNNKENDIFTPNFIYEFENILKKVKRIAFIK